MSENAIDPILGLVRPTPQREREPRKDGENSTEVEFADLHAEQQKPADASREHASSEKDVRDVDPAAGQPATQAEHGADGRKAAAENSEDQPDFLNALLAEDATKAEGEPDAPIVNASVEATPETAFDADADDAKTRPVEIDVAAPIAGDGEAEADAPRPELDAAGAETMDPSKKVSVDTRLATAEEPGADALETAFVVDETAEAETQKADAPRADAPTVDVEARPAPQTVVPAESPDGEAEGGEVEPLFASLSDEAEAETAVVERESVEKSETEIATKDPGAQTAGPKPDAAAPIVAAEAPAEPAQEVEADADAQISDEDPAPAPNATAAANRAAAANANANAPVAGAAAQAAQADHAANGGGTPADDVLGAGAPLTDAPRGPSANAAPIAGLASAAPQSAAMLQQIAAGLRTAGSNNVIEIQLDPIELGLVELEFTTRDGTTQVVVTAERDDSLSLLRRNQEDLARHLREAGFESFDISFADRETGEDGRRQNAAGDGFATTSELAAEGLAEATRFRVEDRLDMRA